MSFYEYKLSVVHMFPFSRCFELWSMFVDLFKIEHKSHVLQHKVKCELSEFVLQYNTINLMCRNSGSEISPAGF